MNKLMIVIVATTLSACNQSHQNATAENKNGYVLAGKLAGLGNNAIFLTHRTDNGTVIDTVIAKNDSFSFSGTCTLPRIYGLQWYKNDENQNKVKVTKEVFMENAVISVAGNIDSPAYKIIISGSPTQTKYNEYLAMVKPLDDKMDSLENLAGSLDEQKNKKEFKEIDSAYGVFDDQKKGIAANFITKNKASQVSSFIALRNFGTESATAGTLDSIFQSLDTVVQHGYYGKQLSDLILSLKQTEVGMPAPAFTLNDTSGLPVSLNSYQGKVVLIDFWASWCGPCRHENPNVVKAYQKFHSKGLEILGVSLDEKHDKWVAAIQKDSLSWHHVSDLKGWGNSVAKLYAVRSIPNNYLIDKNGIIVAKSLYGDDLTGKLKEIFK